MELLKECGVRSRRFVLIFVAMFILGGLPTLAQSAVPYFNPSECPFPLPTRIEVVCGYVTVLEDHNGSAGGETIELAVAMFKSSNPNAASDPLIYLDGGPGGSTLETAQFSFGSLVGPFLDNRDVILFDQRGVGLSRPALDCPEYDQFAYDTLDDFLTTDEYVKLITDALAACGTRLAAEGINLAAYNSAQNAADVSDLRVALGYDQVNLLGISYGTKLALTTMRDHPAGIRSVIIDSVYPPQVSQLDIPLNADRAFTVLFEGCAADAACNAAYPDLRPVFLEVFHQLTTDPVTTTVFDPSTRKTMSALIDGDAFVGLLFQALYGTDIIPELPKGIYDAHNGDFAFFRDLIRLQFFQLDAISIGMNEAVQCAEEFAFDTPETIAKALASTPEELRGFARRALLDPAQLTLCQVWNAGQPNTIENEPVVSGIPTLVFSGEYDPITSPDFARLAAQTLSNSFFFEFPGTGHGVITSNACPLGMALDFLADPSAEPDAACIATMTGPQFTVDLGKVVTLVPFTDDQFGISGVKPAGWQELQPGIFGRGATAFDQTSLWQQTMTQRALLGVSLDETASGAVIAEVVPDSAAQRAGLREGDIITAVNGQAVSSVNETVAAVRALTPHAEATFDILRNGETISVEAVPGITGGVVPTLASQFGLDSFPDSTGSREANGLIWALHTFEANGVVVDVAVTRIDQTDYFVLLTSPRDEHDGLYNEVFVPAVDALKPL
jgi:pimeloyl-ACP methyl ester carboxylesterase